MNEPRSAGAVTLSIVIPCYNEERTLRKCVEKVLGISDDSLSLEVIIVDDGSTDGSLSVARELEKRFSEIVILQHEKNQGKGAALRSGFQRATGDFVAVQDADLEYDPTEFKKLLGPLINDDADVVFGSRFLASGAQRVLYFWHSLGNRFLTFLSNMFTDLNLTDMETCYKVFRREVIQSIRIEESRFGFEPEIVAKVAHKRLRIFEMGISYYGRTYEEGKKITAKDGLRAIYCIFRYNAHVAPLPVQLMLYVFIGGIAAAINISVFLALFSRGFDVSIAAPLAFTLAAAVNYLLCIMILFRHKAKWKSLTELALFMLVVCLVGLFDLILTKSFIVLSISPGISKLLASSGGFVLNFSGRRYVVFPEAPRGAWKPQRDM